MLGAIIALANLMEGIFILYFMIAGALLGGIGGIVFAPFFTLLTPNLTARSARAGVGAVLGVGCGMIGVGVAAETFSNLTFAIGSGGGALTGLICGACSESKYGDHKDAA